MPGQIVVVGRSRRGFFAIPRAVPDWLRSIWAAFSLPPTSPDSMERGADAPWSLGGSSYPSLLRDGDGEHRCVGCLLCVEVCPTHCLLIDTAGSAPSLHVTRFDLDRGACIGCGFCASSCPEEALGMGPDPVGERVLVARGSAGCDLLGASR